MLEYRRDLHDSQNYTLATVLRFAYLTPKGVTTMRRIFSRSPASRSRRLRSWRATSTARSPARACATAPTPSSTWRRSPGRRSRAPRSTPQIDQPNLVFAPHVLPGPRRHDGRLPELGRGPPQRLLPGRLRRQVQPRHLAEGPDQELHVQEGVRRDAPVQGPPRDGGVRRGGADAVFRGHEGRRLLHASPTCPDGAYTVKVWHPKLKAAQKSVTVAGPTAADFEIAK